MDVDKVSIDDIEAGYKIPVLSPMQSGPPIKCEVLSKKEESGNVLFYIHYIGLNRRYDRWVTSDQFILTDLNEIELPKKKKKDERKKVEDEGAKSFTPDDELKLKNINSIIIRNYKVDAWYFSPYPKDIIKNGTIFLCEFCLYYFSTQEQLNLHAGKCDLRHPPGIQIYEEGNISFFEIDGYIQKNYCRNLALLSKLFLDHKSLYYDIDVFMFYVLCERDEKGYQIVGYFSKEKISEQGFNLACILTLPYEQRKGYGKILIDFSYMLSKKDNRISGPEKPLSDLGLLSYRAYWLEVILEELSNCKTANIKNLSKKTHISEDDILGTLIAYKMVKYYGEDLILVIDEGMQAKMMKGRKCKVKPECLIRDY